MVVAAQDMFIICVDNSDGILGDGGMKSRLQLEALRLYIKAVHESDPKSTIGILTMGRKERRWLLFPPTNEPRKIRNSIAKQILAGGDLDFVFGTTCSQYPLNSVYTGVPPSKQKRVLFFTGGPIKLPIQAAKMAGNCFKQENVAVDIINFCLEERHYRDRMALYAFFAAANKNNNSRIIHIKAEPGVRMHDVASKLKSPLNSVRIPAMIPHALMEEGDAARNEIAKDPKGKNQAAAKAHDEYVKALGMERDKHDPLDLVNLYDALSPDHEKVKLGKGKMVCV